jgi:hypothetical protein
LISLFENGFPADWAKKVLQINDVEGDKSEEPILNNVDADNDETQDVQVQLQKESLKTKHSPVKNGPSSPLSAQKKTSEKDKKSVSFKANGKQAHLVTGANSNNGSASASPKKKIVDNKSVGAEFFRGIEASANIMSTDADENVNRSLKVQVF